MWGRGFHLGTEEEEKRVWLGDDEEIGLEQRGEKRMQVTGQQVWSVRGSLKCGEWVE